MDMSNVVRAAPGSASNVASRRSQRDRKRVVKEYAPHDVSKRCRNDEEDEEAQEEVVAPKRKYRSKKSSNSKPSNSATKEASTSAKRRGRPPKKAVVQNFVLNNEEEENENQNENVAENDENLVEPEELRDVEDLNNGARRQEVLEDDDELEILEVQNGFEREEIVEEGILERQNAIYDAGHIDISMYHRLPEFDDFEPERDMAVNVSSNPLPALQPPKFEPAALLAMQVKQEQKDNYLREALIWQNMEQKRADAAFLHLHQQDESENIVVKQEYHQEEPRQEPPQVVLRADRDIAELYDSTHLYAGLPLNVAAWKAADVSKWLGLILDQDENLEKVQQRTISEGINGQVLLMLLNPSRRENVVKDLAFPVGPLLLVEDALKEMFNY